MVTIMGVENKDIISAKPKMTIANAADFLGVSVQAVHKQLKSKGITCPKLGNKSYITHSIARQLFNLDFRRKVVVGQIVKGGTGKTTTIQNVASCANAYGARILMIDTDPQGNLTDVNSVDAENHPVLIDIIKGDADIKDSVVNIFEGIDLLPSRIENVILDNVIVNERLPLHTLFSDLLAPIVDQYDYIFVDCPPTMGQAVTAASLFADIILAPLNPDKFSAKGLKILKQEVETLNKRFKKQIAYRVYLNKFSGKTILSDKAIVSLISDPDLEGKVISTTVQYSQEIPNITDENKNLFSQLKKSLVREDFDRLTRELLEISPEQAKKDDPQVAIPASLEDAPA
jgi:chromosome partitioning protein